MKTSLSAYIESTQLSEVIHEAIHRTRQPPASHVAARVPNPVRVVGVFVEELDLLGLGFTGANPHRQVAAPTIQQSCSSCTSTAISTGFSRAADWSVRHNVTSS